MWYDVKWNVDIPAEIWKWKAEKICDVIMCNIYENGIVIKYPIMKWKVELWMQKIVHINSFRELKNTGIWIQWMKKRKGSPKKSQAPCT